MSAQGPARITLEALARSWNMLGSEPEREALFSRLGSTFDPSERSTWREVLIRKARELLGVASARELRERMSELAKRPISMVDLGTPDGALAFAFVIGGRVPSWRTFLRALK